MLRAASDQVVGNGRPARSFPVGPLAGWWRAAELRSPAFSDAPGRRSLDTPLPKRGKNSALGPSFLKGLLNTAGYRDLIEVTTRLNRPGIEFADMSGVHALTDVIGFAQAAAIGELADGPVAVSVV